MSKHMNITPYYGFTSLLEEFGDMNTDNSTQDPEINDLLDELETGSGYTDSHRDSGLPVHF